MIETAHPRLQYWRDDHRFAFAEMHTDPEVMADLGGPVDEAESKLKFDRYCVAQREYGVGRWAAESLDGVFLGYAGVMPRMAGDHPLGPHFEVGWRFKRKAWGSCYATESAGAALIHAVGVAGITGIVSYTSTHNLRSQAVMKRLGLVRQPALDFAFPVENGQEWSALVWSVPPISHLPHGAWGMTG
ncbi:GNAT family N-acetyltransferase [Mesorhizobium sp. L-2-11]|uniref:GNAT family N-acetyltransferase n=1 Tax=Mesorhizobium sp. L-2-11 TaxID=2744521 RepID=UPI0019277594